MWSKVGVLIWQDEDACNQDVRVPLSSVFSHRTGHVSHTWMMVAHKLLDVLSECKPPCQYLDNGSLSVQNCGNVLCGLVWWSSKLSLLHSLIPNEC